MSDYSIALDWLQFDKNPTWQANYLKRRTIMSISSKYWIVVVIYLINLWVMTIFIIMVVSKLL